MSKDKKDFNGNNGDHSNCDCNHDHGCDCGHEHSEPTVIIETSDGVELECNVLGIFDANDFQYIALLPNGEFDEVLVFRFSEENGEAKIEEIESDEEYEIVSKAFDELFNDDDLDFEGIDLDDLDLDDLDFDDDDDDDDDDYEYEYSDDEEENEE